MTHHHRIAVAALGLTLLTGSCGYTFGTGMQARGIRTVALAVVTNQSFRQRLEVELASKLARELPVSTDLRLATSGNADARLEVRIDEARERTLVPGSATDPVREGTLAAAVTMRLIAPDGRILIERVLLDRTEFRSPIGENLTSARAELVNDLARKIALALDGRAIDADAGRGDARRSK